MAGYVLPDGIRRTAVAFHANYCHGNFANCRGAEDKVRRLEANGMWFTSCPTLACDRALRCTPAAPVAAPVAALVAAPVGARAVNVWGDVDCERWIRFAPRRCKFGNYEANCARTCAEAPRREAAGSTGAE